MIKLITAIGLSIFCCLQVGLAQQLFKVEGNGLFKSPASTNLDILNTDDNTNALLRFGDADISKASIGFNGNDDAFKISMGNTLGLDNFTLSQNGRIGINSAPTSHRLFINHNSTSGVAGSAHLTLRETSTGDFSRLRFQNGNDDGLWVIASRATDGNSLMNFFYNDGLNFANLMSLDGDLFRVGIHQTQPEAFLHIKQQTAGVDVLKFENDDQTGGEIWGWRVGDNDILIYFEGGIRGSFNSDDGVYTNFPPAAIFGGNSKKYNEDVLDQVMQLKPVRISKDKNKSASITLNPAEVEKVNPDWVTRSEDGMHIGLNYQQISVLAIKSIQEQQELIREKEEQIDQLTAEKAAFEERLSRLEARMASLLPETGNDTPTPSGSLDSNDNWPTAPAQQLEQNRPNPFQQKTTIRFSIPETATSAKVQITNVKGEIMRNFNLSKGQSELILDAGSLQSGTYLYSLIVDGELVESKKMVLNK